ncbi:hypothetical protein RJ641_010578 [Dillenia turbinata]|uniref:Replication factor C subunit 3 n=1 Tax=Dillenia turbinata TaxID=194707 RepID=A0AAN8Z8G1_9MAGN
MNSSRHNRSASASRQRQSGYEPSDTETEWQESPWCEFNHRNSMVLHAASIPRRNISPLPLRHISKAEGENPPHKVSPMRRRNSKSPYRPMRENGNIGGFGKTERRSRQLSPYKQKKGEANMDVGDGEIINPSRKQRERLARMNSVETSQGSAKSSFSQRSVSAPRSRLGEPEQKGERTPSPLSRQMESLNLKPPPGAEINELIANAKLARAPAYFPPNFESTDSISPGDIFFSRDYNVLAMQNNVFPKNENIESRLKPPLPKVVDDRDSASQLQSQSNASFSQNPARNLTTPSAAMSRSNTTPSSALSKQSSTKSSTSSKFSDVSGSMSQSFRRFTTNRQKSQRETTWFSCIRKGSCGKSRSPERDEFDEASFIEKAFVVEHLRQFWADKYKPTNLSNFTCHKQEAQLLKQLVSHDIRQHILFKGPSGSGKRSLTMALLHEIFGDAAWNVSHELRYFHLQDERPMQVVVPLAFSAHHVELNVSSEPNARYALMALVKEISSNHAVTPEVSTANFKPDYKVIVLYEVDNAEDKIQHLIKWIMDCYSDSCKLVLCCEDDATILESVKTRSKVIKVDAPVTHEIMEVLLQVARKEDFELSMSFAAKIATKSKQNLRKAIMALEACKAHTYPFVDDQPIPLGWEEVLVELAAEILADPSQEKLFSVRGKIQKMLLDFVNPKLILQKLVEQFLRGIDVAFKKELYYWHAYYDKRLPNGTSALLKLEEFLAKFLSIQRKSSSNRQFS